MRSDLVDNLLISADSQAAHIQAIVDLVVGNVYSGAEIYYRGVSSDLTTEFVTFAGSLADALHENGKLLSMRVDAPVQVSEDRWETGGYDWQKLGRVVDSFRVEAVHTPDAWTPGGQMEQMLAWAVGQVNRQKLQPVLSTHSLDAVDRTLTDIPYASAHWPHLARLSSRRPKSSTRAIMSPLPSRLPSNRGGVQIDNATNTYYFFLRRRWGTVAHRLSGKRGQHDAQTARPVSIPPARRLAGELAG